MERTRRPKPDNELWETSFVQEHVQRAVECGANDWKAALYCSLYGNIGWIGLESPLEAAFYAWWRTLEWARHWDEVELTHQFIVVRGEKTYRMMDFAAFPKDEDLVQWVCDYKLDCPLIGIELDGHEFHERTKEQVSYRDRRDRELTAAGWRIFHFSGSEFHRHPEDCVLEVYSFCKRAYRELYQRARAQAQAETIKTT